MIKTNQKQQNTKRLNNKKTGLKELSLKEVQQVNGGPGIGVRRSTGN